MGAWVREMYGAEGWRGCVERREDTVIYEESTLVMLPVARFRSFQRLVWWWEACPKVLLPEQGVEASWCLFGIVIVCPELLSHLSC